jgi:hypothetical protein
MAPGATVLGRRSMFNLSEAVEKKFNSFDQMLAFTSEKKNV